MTFIRLLWILLGFLLMGCAITVLRFGRTESLQFVKDNADAIKITLGVMAAIYTFAVYHNEMLDNRIANTLAFKEKADSEHLQNVFRTIDMLWIRGEGLPILTRIRKVEKTRNKAEIIEANKEWAKKAREFVREKNQEEEIFAIFNFYRDIVVCVGQGRCHKRTACQLFADDIENFRLTYRRFLKEWEQLWRRGLRNTLKYFRRDCEGYTKIVGQWYTPKWQWNIPPHPMP